MLLVNIYEYEFDFAHAHKKNHEACGLRPPACAAACAAPFAAPCAAPCAVAFAEAYAPCWALRQVCRGCRAQHANLSAQASALRPHGVLRSTAFILPCCTQAKLLETRCGLRQADKV